MYSTRVCLPVHIMLSPVIVLIPGHVAAETVPRVHGGLFGVSLERHTGQLRQRYYMIILIRSTICWRDRIMFYSEENISGNKQV